MEASWVLVRPWRRNKFRGDRVWERTGRDCEAQKGWGEWIEGEENERKRGERGEEEGQGGNGGDGEVL